MKFDCTEIIGTKEFYRQCANELAGCGAYYCGDNLEVLNHWTRQYRAAVDCLYLDPPFFSERDYWAQTGADKKEGLVVYTDRWPDGFSSYLNAMRERLEAGYELLKDGGALFLHCDYRTTAHFRLLLDQIFGAENYVNEIIWYYKTGGVPEKLGFGRKHDTIHFYVKDRGKAQFFRQKEKSYLRHKYGFSNVQIAEDEQGPYTMINCRDVFDIPALRGNQPERISYPTQKPEALIERLILATTKPGDLVADYFVGSGTTAVVAGKNNRRWLVADQSVYSLHVLRKRLFYWQQVLPAGAALLGKVFGGEVRKVHDLSPLVTIGPAGEAVLRCFGANCAELGLGEFIAKLDTIMFADKQEANEPFLADNILMGADQIAHREIIWPHGSEQLSPQAYLRLIDSQGSSVSGPVVVNSAV